MFEPWLMMLFFVTSVDNKNRRQYEANALEMYSVPLPASASGSLIFRLDAVSRPRSVASDPSRGSVAARHATLGANRDLQGCKSVVC